MCLFPIAVDFVFLFLFFGLVSGLVWPFREKPPTLVNDKSMLSAVLCTPRTLAAGSTAAVSNIIE